MNRRRLPGRRKPSTGRRWPFLLAVALTAVFTATGMWLFFRGKLAATDTGEMLSQSRQSDAKNELIHVQLFFADPDGVHLVLEGAQVPQSGEMTDRIKQILAALASGPGKGTSAAPVLWDQARVREVYFMGLEETVYVDFSQMFIAPGTFSVLSERLAIAAIVNSICFNFPQVRKVRILIGGKDTERLGHLDLDQPFERDREIVKSPSGA